MTATDTESRVFSDDVTPDRSMRTNCGLIMMQSNPRVSQWKEI